MTDKTTCTCPPDAIAHSPKCPSFTPAPPADSGEEDRYWEDRQTVECSKCGKVGEARDVHRFKGDVCVECSEPCGEAWEDAKDSLMVLAHRGDFETRRTIRGAFNRGFAAGYACPTWIPAIERMPEPARKCWMNVDGKVRLGGMLMMTQILPPCEKLPPVPQWRYVSLEGKDLGGVLDEVIAWQYFYEPKI